VPTDVVVEPADDVVVVGAWVVVVSGPVLVGLSVVVDSAPSPVPQEATASANAAINAARLSWLICRIIRLRQKKRQ
jgi:hypothetical protein